MKKSILIVAMFGFAALEAKAQIHPLVTVPQIQTHAGQNLVTCDDSPNPIYLSDTVRVRGVIISPGGQAAITSRRQIWIRDLTQTGPFSTLNVLFRETSGSPAVPVATEPDDILTLKVGDTVMITGIVEEFNGTGNPPNNDGETQLRPLRTGIEIIGGYTNGRPRPLPRLLTVGDFNDAQRLNKLTSGEQWESAFVEFRNVTVSEVLPFAGNARVSFNITDAQGNKMNVSDRFLAQRLPTGTPAGVFVAPNVGDFFISIKGIIIHSKNGCANSGGNNRGYELNPYDASHYEKGPSAPSIQNITRNLVVPNTSQAIIISASVIDDSAVAAVKLFYAVGVNNTVYTELNMVLGTGSTYNASIPAQATNGAFVKYYIRATDNRNRNTTIPNVPGAANPLFFVVRNGGLRISDVQYTPYTPATTGYANLNVEITGVVSASAQSSNLGYVYLQESGATLWGGIWLRGGATIGTLAVGDSVRVTGTAAENFDFTTINVTSATILKPNCLVSATALDAHTLTTYSVENNEAYEGMLVRIFNPNGQNLFVVDTNTNTLTPQTANFGEYRVGKDSLAPSQGTAVVAGRQSGTAFSSLNVSYINNIRWATADGLMNVPTRVVRLNDRITSITGIVYFSFGQMKLLPRNNADFVGGITSNRQKNNLKGVSMYPNPASSAVSLKVSKSIEAQIRISDLSGRTLIQTKHSGLESEINTQNLASGLYQLSMIGSAGELVYQNRLVIVK